MVTVYERLHGPNAEAVRTAKLWWAMALRGIVAIAFGALALLWPINTLLTLVLIFAVYCIADASFSIVLAIHCAKQYARWWWPALHALVALAAAAASLLYPGLTALVFVGMLVAWALLTGLFLIAAAFRLDGAHGRWWLVAGGTISLVLAAFLLVFPGVGLLTLTMMIAFQALSAGSLLVGAAFRLRMKCTLSAAAERIAAERYPRTRGNATRAPQGWR